MGACWTVATQSVCLPIFYHSFLHASSRCHGFICSLWLWYFLIILTYYFCLCCASLSTITACLVFYYQPCLLMWCLTIGHVSGVMPHYQAWLLVCCLTTGHAFWCGPELSTMPVGVVPHYRPAMSAGPVPLQPTFLLVECR